MRLLVRGVAGRVSRRLQALRFLGMDEWRSLERQVHRCGVSCCLYEPRQWPLRCERCRLQVIKWLPRERNVFSTRGAEADREKTLALTNSASCRRFFAQQY
mmetsp:Transcript_18758/g.43823  ORF Transcript_18758/g.43823 Transcript_18758/m.43823 type:complete len:101 (-) Transcript_18758:48-350(-)